MVGSLNGLLIGNHFWLFLLLVVSHFCLQWLGLREWLSSFGTPVCVPGHGFKKGLASMLANLKPQFLRYPVGDGKNMYDFTYVENVAHANICAEKALRSDQLLLLESGALGFISSIQEGLGYQRYLQCIFHCPAVL
uniref:3-beta hydroxysteroid dehydrogenase/isomerase domain-containing protein n=1 Tax=Ananas comosus var. bracteatus TaxID=296719 RepID=A0A6V7PY78_ANACO|nr:unnamed protein product [Ananas comosus var. bracteatus]